MHFRRARREDRGCSDGNLGEHELRLRRFTRYIRIQRPCSPTGYRRRAATAHAALPAEITNKGRRAMPAATILVVDDKSLVREAIADMLGSEGYSVLVAGSADEALQILADGARLDLIVSDVRMPDKDGFSLAVEVRQTHPELPFVFLAGYMLSPERDAALGRVLCGRPLQTERSWSKPSSRPCGRVWCILRNAACQADDRSAQ